MAIALTAAACGGDSPGPGPLPPPGAPQIACGAAIVIDNVTGASQPVSYPPPQTTAGAPPVTVTCTPSSGAEFALGETPVVCTALDALARQASCSFTVTLRHKPLSVTRIMAYGDSLTQGENGRLFGFLPIVDLPNSYPTALQQLFLDRIPAQPITVFNEGLGGERVTENEDRQKDRLAALQPQVMLLLQGMNDVIARVPVEEIATAVDDSIRRARDRGVQYIFVATLPPQARENCTAGGPPCRADTVSPALLDETNQRIRSAVAAAASLGAHLVELHDQMRPDRLQYIDVDGLHMSPAGNRAIATLFWDRIVEVIPAPQLTGLPMSSLR
jgi:lysophospholipase L1-like esterase